MTLNQIGEAVLEILTRPNFSNRLTWKDYHGFLKARIPQQDFVAIAHQHHFDAEAYQAEIVEVKKDLSDEVHLHRNSRAFCIVLGQHHGFHEARKAFTYLNDQWNPVKAGDVIDILAGTPHGFTIQPGGELFFLSIQTPPIEGVSGDDYEKVEDAPPLRT